MKIHIFYKTFIVVLICFVAGQQEILIEELVIKGTEYYTQGDYINAIIIYENLLAEQELIYENDDIRIAETLAQLGEMYSILDKPEFAEYYFQQAIVLFEKSFKNRKPIIEE